MRYEDLRDKDFTHLGHEEEDDLRATQLLRFRPNRLGQNHISDSGIIERITCVNFMCHERLTCDLGPLLNFIVGENGSGKSAILTAVTVCLGGKASSTNRGGSLKSFIKEGRDRAILAVQIKNQGDGAFRHDVYGDAITVERHFTKTGQSGFKVKSALNRTISTKKSEVDEIVEYFCLQVDNPLNILSQDNARQFLNASTKAQKYKFFIEGVQLQQLDNDYRLIAEHLEQMESKVPELEERVRVAKGKQDEAQRLKQIYDGNAQMRLQYRNLGNQIAWAQVDEQDRELEVRQGTVADTERKVADAEASVQEYDELVENATAKVEQSKVVAENAKAEEMEYRQTVEEAAEFSQGKEKELQSLHADERDAYSAAKNERTNLRDLEDKIAAEQQRLEAATGDAHARKRAELAEAERRLNTIEQEMKEKRGQDEDLVAKVEAAKRTLTGNSDSIRLKLNEIRDVKSKISQLEQTQGSPYDAYEPRVSTLVQNIARETRFQSRPIGPIGAHVHLKKPEWSAVLEATLSRQLNSFIVTSVHDQKILNGMIRQLGIKNCPIVIGTTRTLDLDGKEPDPKFDTIMRVLDFDNTTVRDQLIISAAIEQVILITERTRAEEVMFNGPPPRNVKACVCKHDRKRDEGLRLTNINSNIGTSPIQSNPNLRQRMKADSRSQVAFLRESLLQLENEHKALEGERRLRSQEHQRCMADLEQHKRAKVSLESALRKCQVEIEQKETELDEFDGVDGRLRGLQAQLDEAKVRAEHFAHQYADLKVKKDQKATELKKAKEGLRKVSDELRRLESSTLKAEQKAKLVEDGRTISIAELNQAHAAVQIAKEDLEKVKAARDRQIRRVEQFTHDATQCHAIRLQIKQGETVQSLQKQHAALGKRIEEQKKKHGVSESQILERFRSTQQAYKQSRTALKSTIRVNHGFKAALNQRLEKWRLFQRNIGAHSRSNFKLLLSERGFRGQLVINHKDRTLDLQVEPDRTEKKATGRSTKTLSGGEKSFSSICLLLAIWEAMGSPLRCLDEFDVFMDNVNRAISTNMLVCFSATDVISQLVKRAC